jgi:hypothetical protein
MSNVAIIFEGGCSYVKNKWNSCPKSPLWNPKFDSAASQIDLKTQYLPSSPLAVNIFPNPS